MAEPELYTIDLGNGAFDVAMKPQKINLSFEVIKKTLAKGSTGSSLVKTQNSTKHRATNT